MKKLIIAVLLLAVCVAPVLRAEETKEEHDARMAWFRDARFGMFIHWGVYSVPAGEWKGNKGYGEWFMEETHMPVSQYEQFAKQFNPVKFDAKQWASIAKNAGMKYIVITSKHHDGFGMWPSKLTDWCIKRTPFHRDPLKELADACHEAGIKMCFYHSIMDWHSSDWGTRRAWNDVATGTPDMDKYTEYMKGQLKELLSNYGPIGILWFDGEWESPWNNKRGLEVYNFCRSLQPNLIINNRIGKGRAGMDGIDKGKGVGDYGTPEQEIPATGFGSGVDWESCMTMNNHWGYNKNDHNWKSTTTLIRNLIDCASKGGNYLLNVGPTAEGLIPAPSVERLAEIGQWMKVNGEAIYGTTASPIARLPFNGRCTRKGQTLYFFVYNWPADAKLTVPLNNTIKRARLLAEPSANLVTAGNVITLPATAPDKNASVVAVDFEGEPDVVVTRIQQATDGAFQLAADQATLDGGLKLENKDGGAANIGFWTNMKDSAEWQIHCRQPGNFEVELDMACEPGSAGSEIEVQAGKSAVTGKVASTGSWGKFTKVDLGAIELPQGDAKIVLKAKSKPGEAVANVRAIRLYPVTVSN
jgi:alpha-L-fucosidase